MNQRDTVERRVVVHGLPLLLLLLQACSSVPPQESITESQAPAATKQAQADSNRRMFDGCIAEEEAMRHESLVGESVLITFAWKDSEDSIADLKVPAKVVRIDAPYVLIGFDPRVPNLHLYASVWSYSGHIKGRSDGTFGVDPCSATFEEGGW